ncbi:MAG: hypothetical protein ACYTG0_34345 [Planctomycetota bacterium]|jgi:hypothetical protein
MRVLPFVLPCLSFCLVNPAAAGEGQAIVSNRYENLNNQRPLVNTPVTFSRIGVDGDFTLGVTPRIDGRKLPAQVDVLRRAPDGSIRHALVSFVLPEVAAGGTVRVDWLDEKPADPPPFEWACDRAELGLKLILTTETGGVLTSDVGRAVAGEWTASRRVKVLNDGPVMNEIEVHDVPVDAQGKADPHLDVYWRLRFFSGESSVRVAAVVERAKLRKKSGPEPVQYKFSGVRLLNGDDVLYEEGPFDHLDQSRYRIVAWTEGQLENLHRRPNLAYWSKGRFVPEYRWVDEKSPADVDRFYDARNEMRAKPKRRQGILESGIILRHMPNTGGRWDLGPYPSWAVAYLLAGGGPETYRAILHADGNGGGVFFVHVRQNGAPGYNLLTVEQPPLDRGFRIPLYTLPDGSRTPAQPDHAHAPSIGYVAYLLTGDKYYAEELSFWASYHMGEWPHKGLKWQSMDRSFAWSLRQVVDAAFILPDDHPLVGYFSDGVSRCLDEMTDGLVKSSRRVHCPTTGNFQCSGRQNWVNAMRCSAWMYAWVVWALGNAADKGFEKAPAVRDWAAEYIVGLYTSEDEFLAPDGKTYRYDPRDAMPYSTAIATLKTKVVDKQVPAGDGAGTKTVKSVEVVDWEPQYSDNYGAVWYYTKLNVDNGWYDERGPDRLPDENGVWPLLSDGFGGGMMYWAYDRKQRPHFNYHLQAMTGLAVAVEAGVPGAQEAWKRMMELGGRQGEYGIQIVPRAKGG